MRKLVRQICVELDIQIIEGKMSPDHVHLFLSYPPYLSISDIAQKIKGKSSYKTMAYFPQLRKVYWGRHFWARGYFAVSSGNITNEMIQKYIEQQEGEFIAHQGDIEMS